jgi:hypothetical protein
MRSVLTGLLLVVGGVAGCATDASTDATSSSTSELGASCTLATPFSPAPPNATCYGVGTFTLFDGETNVGVFCERFNFARGCWDSLAVDCYDGALSSPYWTPCDNGEPPP